ncbi:ABC transporter substrate-binding protein [Cytobacillus gottheilii]|uniref:ABC transporter substrate-binding protein n=1 Tax=Cytobacillus gottheilii TaxID=859144 RepID=UPI0009BBF7BA|nr:ABC transporter substrate-binding protein [Cytobacillus gottheilii]
MKNKKFAGWLSSFMLILFLSACNTAEDNTERNEQSEQPQEEESASYTVTDDMGTEVTFEEVPETVVSLQPSNTEILFALDAGDKVVGVTDVDNYPEEVQEIEKVSDSMTVNAEKVIELNPDVVIAYTVGAEEQLQPIIDSGIPVFVIQSALTFEDVYGDIQQIADVMGVGEKGEELVQSIQEQIASVDEKLEGIEQEKQLYLEISPAPDIYTTGSNTFQQEILKAAHVGNVFGDQEGWIKVSEEDIISRNPEVIATTVNYVDHPIEELKGRTGWDQIAAISGDAVYQLDSDITSRPGPRIGEAVQLVAETVYPEVFQ